MLVVEVADSSLTLDTTTTAELYATAGVPDCSVVDLENRKLLVFRDPEPLRCPQLRIHRQNIGGMEHCSANVFWL